MSDWLLRISRLLMGEPKDQEQLIEVLRHAESRHVLSSEALEMLEGVLHVKNVQASDIMIPRPQMDIIESHWPFARVMQVVIDSGHSRFPVVHHENTDEILGLLHSKDLLPVLFQNKPFELLRVLRPMMVVPESKLLDSVLREFRLKHTHMAVVVDEYGHISGLVTIEDVLEQIVGEIEDEHDTEEDTEENIVKQSETVYLINAQVSLDEFNEYFKTKFAHEEFKTIGGFILSRLGRLPSKGETIDVDGYLFKIIKGDSRRISQVELTIASAL